MVKMETNYYQFTNHFSDVTVDVSRITFTIKNVNCPPCGWSQLGKIRVESKCQSRRAPFSESDGH